jgi:hypothetical protein
MMANDPQRAPVPARSPEELRRQRSRSVAIALALGALALLFYVVTWAKMGAQILNRPL